MVEATKVVGANDARTDGLLNAFEAIARIGLECIVNTGNAHGEFGLTSAKHCINTIDDLTGRETIEEKVRNLALIAYLHDPNGITTIAGMFGLYWALKLAQDGRITTDANIDEEIERSRAEILGIADAIIQRPGMNDMLRRYISRREHATGLPDIGGLNLN